MTKQHKISMIELNGITWEHSRGFDPMIATARAFESAHSGVKINWRARSLQAFADAPLEELANRFDLIVLDHPHMGLVARSKCVVPLDTLGRDAELCVLAQQSVGPSHRIYEYDGHQWALAIDAATQVACMRPDLLSVPPTTWDQVLALAKTGRVIWPCKAVDTLMSFFTIAANLGTPCSTDDPSQMIAEHDARNVLSLMCELASLVPASCATMNPPQAYELMCSSDQYVYCPLGYGYTNYSREGYRDKPLVFTDIPGVRGSCIGGTGIAISSRCQHVAAAADYAFWVAGAECQRTLYFDAGGQPAHSAAWHDPHCNAMSRNFFTNTRATLDNTFIRPRYDGYLNLQDEGGTLINKCLQRQTSINETISQLQAAYQRSHRR